MSFIRPLTRSCSTAVAAALALTATLMFGSGCQGRADSATNAEATVDLGGDAASVARDRNLTPNDVVAALKTYMPSGRLDDYVMFASGGHSGQVLVIGVPSMRLLKLIAVFTPEPWQGWGTGSIATQAALKDGEPYGRRTTWGDTHHPALSETNGSYDGQFLFIGDKANARIAVIDLRDFETKQILANPLAMSDHGAAFVTPNTDWVIEGGQYATPLGVKYAPIEDYEKSYRGLVTFWKFDRAKGRIDKSQSFAMELPPYWQDLCDAGKLASDGWVFCNSFNTEMATGGVEKGQPPFEAGASQHDMDYLHIINLKKAVEAAAAGKVETINGFRYIPLKTAVEEHLLYFAPEPKSPHGVDVTPDGEFMVVAGKLDPHVTVYSVAKMKAAIEKESFEKKDPYGVPVLKFDEVKEAQIELGLGPLHTQYDDKGYAYTTLFLDSAVARWTLGGSAAAKHSEPPWKLLAKLPLQYNVGHLAAAEGDTATPAGKYLVAMDKWSVDRFQNVGPLLPQNFQLVDISSPGDRLQLLSDMPIGIGEPHYAQIIKADKLHAWEVYPEVGWDPHTQAKDPNATLPGKERVERKGNHVEIWMTAVRSHFNPEHVELRKGDHVVWHITNVERAKDATHGFGLPYYNLNLSLEPGETDTIEFDADREGSYSYYCTEFCSALHLEMVGYMLVNAS